MMVARSQALNSGSAGRGLRHRGGAHGRRRFGNTLDIDSICLFCLAAPAHSAGADVLSLRETAAEDATAGNGIAGYRPVPISVCAWAYRAASRYASSCAALR